ncbi:MAG: glycoside hydrolase family 5 protein [Oscillospiraceae bacterium]|nr:glycoside hydrolase family 5 protein [Oscillospiraceae bacterium]
MAIGKKGIIILIAVVIAVAAIVAFVFFMTSNEVGSGIGLESDSGNMLNDNNNVDSTHGSPLEGDAFDLLASIGVGWNLGNTLDSLDARIRGITGDLPDNMTAEEFYETLWGNPVTTFEMIESVAQMGFGAVRIPVTWTDHMDGDFNINESWLNRVEQVVNYVLDNDMYAIINVHHDNGSGRWPWLRADMDNIDWMKEHFHTVWHQIAGHFIDYCERLIFESFNEILDADSNWSGSDRNAHEAVNVLNHVFVETVRNTGGNNADRFLIVKTYGAIVYESPINDFVLPEDSVPNRLIVGVHFYGTHGFVSQQEDIPWTVSYSEWDYHRNGGYTVEIIGRLRDNFVNRGIPVVITEFGASNKNNTTDRINYAIHYVETARQYGIATFWWDDGGQADSAEDVRNYALLDRFNNTWFFPEIAEAIVGAAS